MNFTGPSIALLGTTLFCAGCAGTYESSVRRDVSLQNYKVGGYAVDIQNHRTSETSKSSEEILEQGLRGYIAIALDHQPEIHAAFARWKASVHRIALSRTLPEPTLGFGYFIESIQTRTGPQQARFSLQQTFPWPTKLTAGADAASAQARAMQRQFEALILRTVKQVTDEYWDLWALRTARDIHQDHLEVMIALTSSIRARVATGATLLADAQQIDLAIARLEDSLVGMDETEAMLEAKLKATMGIDTESHLPTIQAPDEAALPEDSPETLTQWALEHPLIESLSLQAEASEAAIRVDEAARFPSFSLGLDWILIGEAPVPSVEKSGQDAVALGANLQLPLWQGSYSDRIASSQAEAEAKRAEQRAMSDQIRAAVTTSLSQVRDAARRANLYQNILVPQAQSAYDSVLGAYTVGQGTVAQTLLAQRDLLELRIELVRAQAEHAQAWTRLEELTSRTLKRADNPSEPEQRSTP